VAIALVVLTLFSQSARFPFLNWDDQEVFVRNTALHSPGLLAWAFTTTYMEHYQPLAWLTWGAVDRAWTLTPTAAHALNACLHALCAVLVFVVARRSLAVWTAAVAALLFAMHPLRVEVAAWASAMPYALALSFALLSLLAFLDAGGRWWGMALAIALYAMSLITRPIAIGLPVVLVIWNWEFGIWKRVMPFALLAVAAAFVESLARTGAAVSGVSVGARLTLASTAPFRYLWRTVAPFHLTPLDPLALTPRADVPLIVLSAAALLAISWAAWRWRRDWPGALLAWASYLALLAPASGLLPSGLQATADRYTYLPAVPLSIWMAGASGAAFAWLTRPVARLKRSRHVSVLSAVATLVIVGLAWLSYQQIQHWRSSVALWTRALELDPSSDVALYNLASALAEAGRRDEASARYDEVLRLVPDHAGARRNRDLLRAAAAEDEANRLAQAGGLDAAIERYRRAVALDPARTHSQAALGMALVQTGRASDAVPYLREAIRLGAPEPAVPNALAFALVNAGRDREACDVLEAARERFPGDANVARNLAQMECRKP
jgi:tetratricopeptide (TPR) repeat protein